MNPLIQAIDERIKTAKERYAGSVDVEELEEIRRLTITEQQRIVKELSEFMLDLPAYGIVGDDDVAKAMKIVEG